MKISLFITYPLRSLWRGGGPMRLAILCIALGVMEVVSTQLVGQMAINTYTSNTRTVIGGDISIGVGDNNTPITQHNLRFLDQLKQAQTINDYTPVDLENGSIGNTPAPFSGLLTQIIDPQHFPLVAPPTFIAPRSGSLARLLTKNQIVVTQTFLTYYHKQLGDMIDLQIQSPSQNGATRTLHVRVAGVIANTGRYPQGNTFVLVSFAAFQAASPSLPITYSSVEITTANQADTNQAIHAIQDKVQQGLFPPIGVQTVASVQQHIQAFNQQVAQLQELAALLVLLIGGLGIMNTMQMLLARRTTEIAILKTTGYSRSNLALLFGMEAAMLGLFGGAIGTGAALIVSYSTVITLAIPFTPDPWIILSGLALGMIAALTFGLQPIVQSMNIRPSQIMREQTENGIGHAHFSTMLLFGITSLLFCALASAVLQNIVLGCASVCGTELFLGVLYLCFRPIIRGISIIPVPEQLNSKFLLIVLASMMLAAVICLFQVVLGSIIMACACCVLLLRIWPRTWKMNIRIAIRNIGRRPTRTTMLMLILFVGVFVIGSIQAISQNLQSQLATTINQELSYNVIAKVPQSQAPNIQAQLTKLPSIISSHTTTIAATTLVAINGQAWKNLYTSGNKNSQTASSSATSIYQLFHASDGVEGYDLVHQHLPDPHSFQIMAGRNLNASDAGTNHVLLPYMANLATSFHITIGSTLTITNTEGKDSTTLQVVGEYAAESISLTHISPILTSQSIVKDLGDHTIQTIFYLKVNPVQTAQVETSIRRVVPTVTYITTPASNVDAYLQGIAGIAETFTVIAALVLLAGIIVMANAVILDLLERRRELGILKALGYTQKTIRGEILLEYGIIGGTSAVLAVFLIILGTNLLGTMFLRATSSNLSRSSATVTFSFSANSLLLIGLIASTILLVLVISWLASWRTLQVRPLEILRYE